MSTVPPRWTDARRDRKTRDSAAHSPRQADRQTQAIAPWHHDIAGPGHRRDRSIDRARAAAWRRLNALACRESAALRYILPRLCILRGRSQRTTTAQLQG